MQRKRPGEQDPQSSEKSEALLIVTGMQEWRQQHLHATLREIDPAMDERLARSPAGILEALVKRSPHADWSQAPAESRPRGERCGGLLVSRGKQSRWRQTRGGEQVRVECSNETCPHCGQGLLSLAEKWELTGRDLTPQAQEGLGR